LFKEKRKKISRVDSAKSDRGPNTSDIFC
jgi:hypothetical protein